MLMLEREIQGTPSTLNFFQWHWHMRESKVSVRLIGKKTFYSKTVL